MVIRLWHRHQRPVTVLVPADTSEQKDRLKREAERRHTPEICVRSGPAPAAGPKPNRPVHTAYRPPRPARDHRGQSPCATGSVFRTETATRAPEGLEVHPSVSALLSVSGIASASRVPAGTQPRSARHYYAMVISDKHSEAVSTPVSTRESKRGRCSTDPTPSQRPHHTRHTVLCPQCPRHPLVGNAEH